MELSPDFAGFRMLQAGLFSDFKGADTLLIWGDGGDVDRLFAGLKELVSGSQAICVVTHPETHRQLTITACDGGTHVSEVTVHGEGMRWICSNDVIAETVELVSGLATAAAGHQYIEAAGPKVAQVLIAKNEYPADLQPDPRGRWKSGCAKRRSTADS